MSTDFFSPFLFHLLVFKMKSWHEQFIYRLELDDRGLIARYEVWADPLSAFLAAREGV
jgi:hypothetical protein